MRNKFLGIFLLFRAFIEGVILWPMMFQLHLRWLHFRGKKADRAYRWMACWARAWQSILHMTPCEIRVEGPVIPEDQKERVLIISNHRSYLDIIVLQGLLNKPCGWVYKKSLQWLPIFGGVLKYAKFPAIDRSSQGSTQVWQRELDRYFTQGAISSLAIFPEGTRYSEEKVAKSRYHHVLNPHIGGLSYILDRYQKIYDITLLYSGEKLTGWAILFGQVSSITVIIKDVSGSLDASSRRSLHQSLNQLWQEKDECLQSLSTVQSCSGDESYEQSD